MSNEKSPGELFCEAIGLQVLGPEGDHDLITPCPRSESKCGSSDACRVHKTGGYGYCHEYDGYLA